MATLRSKMQGKDLSSFMETVFAQLDKAKSEIPVQKTTSINALAIKGMLKEIII